jgi:hypothetical protein
MLPYVGGTPSPKKKKKKKVTKVYSAPTLSKKAPPVYHKPPTYNLPSQNSPTYKNRSTSKSSYGWKPTVAPRPVYMPQEKPKPKPEAPTFFDPLDTNTDQGSSNLLALFNYFKDNGKTKADEATGSSGLGGLLLDPLKEKGNKEKEDVTFNKDRVRERGEHLREMFEVPEKDIRKDPNSDEALVDKGLKGAPKLNKKGEVVGLVGQNDKETDRIQELLNQLKDPKAPEGTTGPALPDKFKKNKDGTYKNWWNQEYIDAYLSGPEMVYNSDKIRALNDILEHQMDDKENWLLGENARKYNKVNDVLTAAEEAAFKGDFGYLERYMKKNPEFSLEAPKYKAVFGVDSDDVWKSWEKQRKKISNPYDAKGLRYRTDMVMRHYDDLQNKAYFRKGGVAKQLGFDQLRASINDRVAAYKDKYGDSAEFRGVSDKVGSGIPEKRKTDKKALNLYDKAAQTQYAKHGGKDGEEKRKQQIKREFGLKRLPSVNEMLASKVQSGELNPNDDDAVEAWIWRFKRLDHVETRAMIASWARSHGKTESGKKKDLEKKTMEFVNEPIKTYTSSKGYQEELKGEARRAKSADVEKHDGIIDTITDFGSKFLSKEDQFADKHDWYGESLKDRTKPGGDFAEGSELMDLLDAAQRPLNAVAGMFDAIYSMDDEASDLDTDRSVGDEIKNVFEQTAKDILDPLSQITGASWLDSIDDLSVDKAKKVPEVGYEQLLRDGGGTEGLPSFIPTTGEHTPILFSNVIANAALRDPENNAYDKEWYQHTAGFVLDMTADPLNFVGVGVVDNVLKAPARAVKDAAIAGSQKLPRSETDAIRNQLLSNLKDTQSPAVQKAFVTNQALHQIGTETEIRYVTKDLVFPKNISLDATTSARITNQISELKVQEAKLKNDAGLETLKDTYKKITGEVTPVGSDLRVSKLTKANLTDDVSNPGGAIWSRYVEPLRAAAESKSLGRWSKEVFDETTASGRKAAYGKRKLDELDETETKLNIVSGVNTANRAKFSTYIDEAYDAGTAKTEYSVEKALRSGEVKPQFDLAARVAEASGLSKKDFLALNMIKEEDADIVMYQAATRGRDLLIQSDPFTAHLAQEASDRIKWAEETLRTVGTQKVANKEAYINATKKAMKIARAQQSEITAAGLIKYLDVRRDILAKGQNRLDSQLGLKNELEAKLQRVNDLAAAESGSGGSGLGGNMQAKRSAEAREINYGSFEGDDFDDIEGLVAQRTDEFGSRVEALDAMAKEIKAQIDELDLQDTFEVTGFPPQTAFQLEQMLDADSVFKTKSGAIDTAKVNSQFEFVAKNEFQPFRYKTEGLEDLKTADYEFLDIVKGVLNDEYQGAYRKASFEIKHPHGAKATDEGDVPLTMEQARLQKLGPRPTGESLIAARPAIRQKLMDQDAESGGGFLKKGQTVEVPTKTSDFEDIRPNVNAPETVRFVGKKTKDQQSWTNYVRGKQREWDNKAAKFEEEFKASRQAESFSKKKDKLSAEIGFKIKPGQQKEIVEKAERVTRDKVFESLKTTGALKQTPGSMRMTVNQSFRDLEKQIKLRAEQRKVELELRAATVENKADRGLVEAQIRLVEQEKKRALSDLAKGRMEAIDTIKVMGRRIKEEDALSLLNVPFQGSYRGLEFRIAGMRYSMRSSQALFRAAERAGEMVPAKWAENFKKFWARPTKQLDAAEAVEIRALHTGYGPAIIHAELSRLTSRMDSLSVDQRADMLSAFRERRNYTGPGSGKWEDFKEELLELEDILNGTDRMYQFAPPGKKAQPLTLWEIKRFLPAEWQFDPKMLFREAGANDARLKVDHLLKAVRNNGHKNPKDLNDPFRLAWVYRLAAAQAAQRKTVIQAIEDTFGVSKDLIQKKIPGRGLRDFERLGWQEHKELPGYFFPPESANDVKRLLDFMEPRNQQAIMKNIDTALGYWKQGMTIYNPAYYARNGIGEWMTSYLDGIWEPKYYSKAKQVLNYRNGKGQEMAELMRKWTVLKENVFAEPTANAGSHVVTLKGGRRVNAGEVLRLYYEHGLSTTFVNTDLQSGIRNLASTGLHGNKLTKTVSRMDKKMREAGEGFEDYFRLAHFIGVLEKSGKGSLEKAAIEAAQRVRRSHFDYSDFSNFEKTVMLRAYPFYKWIRRGAPLMLAHMFMTPGKMLAPVKVQNYMEGMGFDPVGLWTDDPVLSTQDVKEDKNGLLPDYQGIAPGFVRDLFAYQMQPAEDDEYAHYFRFQTPQIDGLNFVTSLLAAAGEDSIMDAHGASGGNTLLNPVIKSFLELSRNQNLDPDQPYEIYGGEYNQNMGISDGEAVGTYLARQANPWGNLIQKLLKNEGVIGKGKDDSYQTSRDILSFITGLGFYQGKPQDELTLPGFGTTPVGYNEASELPSVGGVPAAGSSASVANDGGTYADPSAFPDFGGSGWVNYPKGRGWINYPKGRGWVNYGRRYRRGWRNFGGGGYSGSGGGFGGIDGDSSTGTEFFEFIKKLIEEMDQGEVYDG